MNQKTICPECGAARPDGTSCQTDFHEMLYWETEDVALQRVHHLMVLCYHLQHASLYSPQGLRHGRQMLRQFVQHGVTPAQMRRQNRDFVNSGKRKWKIRGDVTPGSWDCDVAWSLTSADVVAGGKANYCDNVEAWALSVHEALKAWDKAIAGQHSSVKNE